MTREQFSKPMERLRAVFGDRYYPPARIEAFHRELGALEADLWSRVADRLILEEVHPPMIKQIRLAIAAERERRAESAKVQIHRETVRAIGTNCPPEIRAKLPHLFKSIPPVRSDDESEAV